MVSEGKGSALCGKRPERGLLGRCLPGDCAPMPMKKIITDWS